MIEIAASHQADYLNFSEEKLAKAEAHFRSAVEEFEPRIPGLLKERVQRMNSSGAMSLDIVHKEQVLLGLNAIFNPSQLDGLASSRAAHVFMFYFKIVWAHANQKQRKGLMSRVLSYANDSQQGFSPLFCELLVGFMYLSKGNDVAFTDLAYDKTGGADLIVRRRELAFAVEVKTVSFQSGSPLEHRIMATCLARLSRFLTQQSHRLPWFEAEIVYKGDRKVSFDSALRSMDEVVRQLASQDQGSSDIWDVVASPCDESRVASLKETAFNPEGQAPFVGMAMADRGVLRYKIIHRWDLAQGVTTAVSKAIRQLPDEIAGVVWVFLTGTPMLLPFAGSSLIARLDAEGRMRDYFPRKFAETKGRRVGEVCIATDPVFSSALQGGPFAESVDFRAEQLGNPFSPELVFLHRACFLRKPTPLQMQVLTSG